MTKLGGAGRAGGLISATVRTVRYYGEADKITVTRGHGQLTTSRIVELESRKPPPLYPEPRAGSRLVLAPVPAILTPAGPADRDIAKTDYQTLTLIQDHRYIYSPSRYLYIVLQWRHRGDCRPRPLQCSPPLFCTTNLVENLRNNIPISMRQV